MTESEAMNFKFQMAKFYGSKTDITCTPGSGGADAGILAGDDSAQDQQCPPSFYCAESSNLCEPVNDHARQLMDNYQKHRQRKLQRKLQDGDGFVESQEAWEALSAGVTPPAPPSIPNVPRDFDPTSKEDWEAVLANQGPMPMSQEEFFNSNNNNNAVSAEDQVGIQENFYSCPGPRDDCPDAIDAGLYALACTEPCACTAGSPDLDEAGLGAIFCVAPYSCEKFEVEGSGFVGCFAPYACNKASISETLVVPCTDYGSCADAEFSQVGLVGCFDQASCNGASFEEVLIVDCDNDVGPFLPNGPESCDDVYFDNVAFAFCDSCSGEAFESNIICDSCDGLAVEDSFLTCDEPYGCFGAAAYTSAVFCLDPDSCNFAAAFDSIVTCAAVPGACNGLFSFESFVACAGGLRAGECYGITSICADNPDRPGLAICEIDFGSFTGSTLARSNDWCKICLTDDCPEGGPGLFGFCRDDDVEPVCNLLCASAEEDEEVAELLEGLSFCTCPEECPSASVGKKGGGKKGRGAGDDDDDDDDGSNHFCSRNGDDDDGGRSGGKRGGRAATIGGPGF
ncbi:MAG: hypothetical protein SGARI_001184 [Bacillariaceae sp.]